MADLNALRQAIIDGNEKKAKQLVEAAVAEGVNPQTIINDYMVKAMDEVGKLFEEQEFFVPELLISARAMKAGLTILKPLLKESGAKSAGIVVIGTVKGDLHDIGKNLVASLLEGGGFEVIDLGVDVPAEKFVAEAKAKGASIICLSALLTTTMGSMKEVVETLKKANLGGKIKVMVGGAPVTQNYCDEIGASAYSDNASGAVHAARTLLKK